MTMERAKKLVDIGFEWSTINPKHVTWETRYQELKQFQAKYGHAQVSERRRQPSRSYMIASLWYYHQSQLIDNSVFIEQVPMRWQVSFNTCVFDKDKAGFVQLIR